MRSRPNRNYSITHSLTPIPQSPPKIEELLPQGIQSKYNPLYTRNTFINPHNQRSRKHRLIQQKNTDIERENRRLFEKLRKIKLKNAFQSQSKLETADKISEEINFEKTGTKLLLPQVGVVSNTGISFNSLNTTKSELNGILSDRKTFVSKYFQDLSHLRTQTGSKTQQLGNFICNGWKVRVLLLNDEFVLLRGRKDSKERTMKYKWQRVKNRMTAGLQDWVKFKFQFED